MNPFAAFRGLRFDPDRFRPADVTAPPYDVIDEQDRDALLQRSPRNIVVVDLPVERDGEGRYDQAAERLAEWQEEGTLVLDEAPALTVYQMAGTDDLGRATRTLGVIGALELSGPDEGRILPHERTTPKARSDRLDLLRATSTQLSPVWGLSLAKGLSALLEVPEAPLWDWSDDEGVHHTVWRVDDPERVAAIAAAVSSHPIVIADGHHRYETSMAYRDERRRASGGSAGEAEAMMTFVVELVSDQLTVRPIHRLLTGAGAEALVGDLTAAHFDAVGEVDAAALRDGGILRRMEAEGALALVHPDGHTTLLRPRPEAFVDVPDLDSARLDAALAGVPGVTTSYQHGVDLVARAVAEGRATAGVLLRPATVAQIELNAHAGERMPPKTTYFHPKPRTGIVLRPV